MTYIIFYCDINVIFMYLPKCAYLEYNLLVLNLAL